MKRIVAALLAVLALSGTAPAQMAPGHFTNPPAGVTEEYERQLAELEKEIARKNEQIEDLRKTASTRPHANPSEQEDQRRAPTPPSDWWTVTNAMTMCAVVLLFGVLVMGLATYLIRIGRGTEAVLRIFGTLLIILVAVFLVVAGYTDTQIAPVMGLLGTIAGYLLGKEPREKT